MKREYRHIVSERLQEEYYHYKHESGLNVYIIPKDFSSSYAIYATKYGSIEQTFRRNRSEEFVTVPDGVAHFLEHKMFEEPDGSDAFRKFAPLGANANAYTSFDLTAYLFSTTEDPLPPLEVLLSFVSKPHFTDENVAKEQGIIGQEIDMCEDRPGTRLYYTLLRGLYPNNNVSTNIAGTVESISRITPEVLYRCYNTFYHPSNMALCVVGKVTPDSVLDIVDKVLPKEETPLSPEVIYPENDKKIAAEYTEFKMEVSKPLFMLGLRDFDIPADPAKLARKSVMMELISEMLFAKSAPLFTELYEDKLITSELDGSYDVGRGYAHFVITGESDDPHAVVERIFRKIELLRQDPPTREEFERVRRVHYAEFIRLFDSTEEIGDAFIRHLFGESDLLLFTDIMDSVTYEDTMALLNEFFIKEASSVAVVFPIEK